MGGEYDQWVKPLLDYPTWQEFEPIALEYRVCDLKKNVSEQLFCAVMPLCTDVATDPCSACRYVNSVSISVLSRIFSLRSCTKDTNAKV